MPKLIGHFKPGYLYGNPKIHKDLSNPPLRPIISQIGTPTYEVSKNLNDLLKKKKKKKKYIYQINTLSILPMNSYLWLKPLQVLDSWPPWMLKIYLQMCPFEKRSTWSSSTPTKTPIGNPLPLTNVSWKNSSSPARPRPLSNTQMEIYIYKQMVCLWAPPLDPYLPISICVT